MERFAADGIRFGAGSEYPTPMANPNPKSGVSKITSPKGTRDLYPEDALKRRYLEQCWRDASVRCGFEEIHGPTFETTDLYAVKSGEGILGELFQAYSGKAPEEVEQVQATGRAPYAMRPEFTPTLARMYAAKAGSLPKPCKWFTGGPYFRAERPQRGRLREFLQWNVDFLGDTGSDFDRAYAEAECVECCVCALNELGLQSTDTSVVVGDRGFVQGWGLAAGVSPDRLDSFFHWLDGYSKRSETENNHLLAQYTLPSDLGKRLATAVVLGKAAQIAGNDVAEAMAIPSESVHAHKCFNSAIHHTGLGDWCQTFSVQIVRGLAYYTGTVFEVLADGERAIAGGGRYDKLIELMGGPPTPAVGFAMGDVVVSLLLEDKGLMPQGAELMEAVSRVPASVRPEVFVVSGAGADTAAEESAALDTAVRRLSADLRRGVEADAYKQTGERKPWSVGRYDAASGGVRPVHARVSYKSTRNLKKLLADGEKQFARYAAVVHGPDRVQLKDFDGRRDLTPRDVGLSDAHAEFSVDPASPVYVGRAVR